MPKLEVYQYRFDKSATIHMLEVIVQTNKEPVHRRMMSDTFVRHLDISGKNFDLPPGPRPTKIVQ